MSQCKGTTRSGERCKKQTRSSDGYCHLHKNKEEANLTGREGRVPINRERKAYISRERSVPVSQERRTYISRDKSVPMSRERRIHISNEKSVSTSHDNSANSKQKEEVEHDTDCCICFEMNNDDSLQCQECKNYIHEKCLSGMWKLECPLCRGKDIKNILSLKTIGKIVDNERAKQAEDRAEADRIARSFAEIPGISFSFHRISMSSEEEINAIMSNILQMVLGAPVVLVERDRDSWSN